MIFWGVVTIILGLRSETYLEQSMRLNGEDSANRLLEFIHKYGFVSSNSLLLKEIEFTENGLDQGVNSSGEEWCLCKSKLRNVMASKARSPASWLHWCQPEQLSALWVLSGSNVLFTKRRVFSPCVDLTVFRRGLTELGEGRTLPVDID